MRAAVPAAIVPSTRYAGEVLALGLAVGVAGWYGRAPQEAYPRAAYLCAPVGAAVHYASRLQAALDDHDQLVPPLDARLPDLVTDCERLVLRLQDDEALRR